MGTAFFHIYAFFVCVLLSLLVPTTMAKLNTMENALLLNLPKINLHFCNTIA